MSYSRAMLDEFARRDLIGVLHDPCKRRTAITLQETAGCKFLRQSSPTGLQQFSEAQGVDRRRALLIIVEVNENDVTGALPASDMSRPSSQGGPADSCPDNSHRVRGPARKYAGR
jgi:hypothetical protein